MVLFTAHHLFPFPFRDVARGIWLKYPNDYTDHITSVDVLNRSFLPDGTLRTERLITIRQHAPRWIMKLVGGAEEQYVREVIFYKPPMAIDEPPMILMSSVNLSMSSILVCREQIRYQPACPESTAFIQHANIRAQGTLAIGQAWGGLGGRLETWARDRFAVNAATGRQGFTSVLTSLYGSRPSSPQQSSNPIDKTAQKLSDPSIQLV